MCSNRNHCYNYKTSQHYKWTDKFKIKCLWMSWTSWKRKPKSQTQRAFCTTENTRGHLCQRSNKKTQPNSSARRFVRKKDNEVAEEQLSFTETRAYKEAYETQPSKNYKLWAGRLNNSYTSHLCDVYVIFWMHESVNKWKQIRQRLILIVAVSCSCAAFRLSHVVLLGQFICNTECKIKMSISFSIVGVHFRWWKSVSPRCAQNAALRKRKECVHQSGPRALSAGWLGNNTSNRKKYFWCRKENLRS